MKGIPPEAEAFSSQQSLRGHGWRLTTKKHLEGSDIHQAGKKIKFICLLPRTFLSDLDRINIFICHLQTLLNPHELPNSRKNPHSRPQPLLFGVKAKARSRQSFQRPPARTSKQPKSSKLQTLSTGSKETHQNHGGLNKRLWIKTEWVPFQ